jgi:hypothetical protein
MIVRHSSSACAESNDRAYIKSIQEGNYETAFQSLDAVSRLLVYMI